MASLMMLEENYPSDFQSAFEDLCTALFCMELGLSSGVNRRVNQQGIESDPVEVDGRVYAYFSKYYDAITSLADREGDLLEAIGAARREGVTDLFLFVNKDLPDKNADGSGPHFLRDVEYAARGVNAPTVRLCWWSRSRIEATLDMEDYGHIRTGFLGSGGRSRLSAYYEYVYAQFYGDRGGELFGDVPLGECYIEPTVDVRNSGACLSAREWIESFVEGDETIAVLCGEPGHGKTSLCRKAVADFYKSGWLAGRVSNVFCFSLNPANTDAIEHGILDLYALFSWGSTRISPEHRVEGKDCEGALVFLDGFNELLEWLPSFDLPSFVRDYALPFQRATGAHVVVSTRSMAVEEGASALQINRQIDAPIVRLRPITREQQIGWIEGYAEHLRRLLAGSSESLSLRQRDEIEKELAELECYVEQYGMLDAEDHLQNVLGIPIIFRIIVAGRYLPNQGKPIPIARMYDDLFDATWERHDHGDTGPSTDPREVARARLSRHALRVFADDADTAVVDDVTKSPWTFAFYTTHNSDGGRRGRSRVGFLHRSFYQHFLACEVLSWFERFADGLDNETEFRDNLSYLARRRLDETTLGHIRDMHEVAEDKEGFGPAFDKAYAILKETEGVLLLPEDKRDARQIEVVAPLERANNVFWNVVSICNMCGQYMTADNISIHAVRSYDLSNCFLMNSELSGVPLDGVPLDGTRHRGVLLDGARLGGVDFSGAHLSGAHLSGAHLVRANLRQADLCGANLDQANLSRAYLSRADLSGAHLRGADLNGAHLRGATLRQADLRCVDLGQAHLNGSDLGQANLGGANLVGAILRQADLRRADLRQADLRQADLRRADLRGACLVGANLRGADLRGAILEGDDLDGELPSNAH